MIVDQMEMEKRIQNTLQNVSPGRARLLVRLARMVAWLPLPARLWWLRALAGARPGLEVEAAKVAAELL